MALQNLSPPEDVKQALRESIKDYLDKGDPMIKLLSESTFAIPIRSLRVNEVSEMRKEDLLPTAWRLIARHPTGALIGADVAIGPPPRMIGFSRDQVVGDLVAAILKFERLDAAPTDLLMVRIPEVLTDVLWMRTKGQIRIAPIRTQAKEFTEEMYQNEDFEEIIEQLATGFEIPDEPEDESTPETFVQALFGDKKPPAAKKAAAKKAVAKKAVAKKAVAKKAVAKKAEQAGERNYESSSRTTRPWTSVRR